MAREILAYNYGVTQFIVAPGNSNALYVPQVPYQISSILKYVSGGSLEIFGCPLGATALTTVVAGEGYLFSSTEAVSTNGAPQFILCATGATAIAHFLIGLSTK